MRFQSMEGGTLVSDKPTWFQVVSVLEIMVKIQGIIHSEKSPENGSKILQ